MKFDLYLGQTGQDCRVELEGVDISSWLRGIAVRTGVGEMTTITLELVRVDVEVHADPNVAHQFSNWPDEDPFDEDGNAYLG